MPTRFVDRRPARRRAPQSVRVRPLLLQRSTCRGRGACLYRMRHWDELHRSQDNALRIFYIKRPCVIAHTAARPPVCSVLSGNPLASVAARHLSTHPFTFSGAEGLPKFTGGCAACGAALVDTSVSLLMVVAASITAMLWPVCRLHPTRCTCSAWL